MANETISQSRVDQTNQYYDCVTEGKAYDCTSSIGTDAMLWGFQAAGISIYWGSKEREERVADSRCEGSLYRQASRGFGFAFKNICKTQRGLLESFGNPGAGGVPRESGGCLRGNTRSRKPTVLIGWACGRFVKFINFWFQKIFVLHLLPIGEMI
jgi:hypothetical protein